MERKAPLSLVIAIVTLATLGFTLAGKAPAPSGSCGNAPFTVSGVVTAVDGTTVTLAAAGESYPVVMAAGGRGEEGRSLWKPGDRLTVSGKVTMRDGVRVLVPLTVAREGEAARAACPRGSGR